MKENQNNEVLNTNDLSTLLREMNILRGIDFNKYFHVPTSFYNKEFRDCTFSSEVQYGGIQHSIFVNCLFKNSKFAEIDLSKCIFEKCTFEDSEFVDVNFNRSGFDNCKFNRDNRFYLCTLNKVSFHECDLNRVDFGKSSLISSGMRKCKIPNDFYKSFRIPLSPEFLEELKSKVALTILENPDKLDMRTWHCGTSHCIAGWAVHLAGELGYAIEALTSPCVAGYILLPSAASYFHYTSHEEALEWAKEVVESLKPDQS